MKKVSRILITLLMLVIVGMAIYVVKGKQDRLSLESIITSINSKDCIVENDQYGGFRGECDGVGEYGLILLDDDARMSINIVSPEGKEHELNIWSVISRGFSTLGDNIEWKVEKQADVVIPKALIVQVNASEDPDNPDQVTIYHAVVKITSERICITDKVLDDYRLESSQDYAQVLAEAAATKDCLPEIQ